LAWINVITEERIMRNIYLFGNIMFTSKANAASFWGGKGKRITKNQKC